MRSLAYTLMFAFATRAAAVSFFTTATIGLRRRSVSALGCVHRIVALGLVLLIAVSFSGLGDPGAAGLGCGVEHLHPPPRAGSATPGRPRRGTRACAGGVSGYSRSAQAILAPLGAWMTTETAVAPAVKSATARPLPTPSASVVKPCQISLGGVAEPAGSRL